MGIRADMTPQVARIDAHSLGRAEPVRLCYLGTVLHTPPGRIFGGAKPDPGWGRALRTCWDGERL